MKRILLLFFFIVLSSIFLGLLEGSSCLPNQNEASQTGQQSQSQLLNFQKKSKSKLNELGETW
jgi:hypothetical protein